VLKADVRKFFPSVDHEILKARLARKIKDKEVLWLAGRIIDNSGEQEPILDWFKEDDLFTPLDRRRGMPIGNQTSQFFANVYLDALDHFVKDRLGVQGYVRYVDDFVVFCDDKRRLRAWRDAIAERLASLRLRLHPKKNTIFPVGEGIRFLGYRIFPTHVLLAKENVWRLLRRIRRMGAEFRCGKTTVAKIEQRLKSWIGHARQANTYRLRRGLFARMRY
jgi:retron-type reverse transcriptase